MVSALKMASVGSSEWISRRTAPASDPGSRVDRTSTEYPVNEGSAADILCEGAVENRPKLLAEEAGFDVLDDADDLVGPPAAGDALAEGVFVAGTGVRRRLR